MHPVTLARAGAAIDWISGGRFVLQVGMGWNPEEYTAFGLPYVNSLTERSRRLLEGIRLIDALWTSPSPVTFAGEFFSVEEAALWPKPIARPRPPIWIGGSSAQARQVVAAVGDAWTPAAPHYGGMTPDVYAAGIDEIRNKAAQIGRSPAGITAAGFFFVVIDETEPLARAAAAGLLRRDIWKGMSVSELAERGIAFIGTPDDVLAGMIRFVDAGVEYFTVAFMPISGRERTVRQMRLFKPVLNTLAGI
jgi:alkanesulfonate monooxygenase SsuD/methylene tetrahydromethanopterin reductase-like flavin-dependent oxidoreductase (luciferase family)